MFCIQKGLAVNIFGAGEARIDRPNNPVKNAQCCWKEHRRMGNNKNSRYTGKPMLALLEMYVLDSIGCLTSNKKLLAEQLVQKTWGSGEWQSVVRARIGFKDEIDDFLRLRWTEHQELARRNDFTISPEEFAMQTVDINFAHLVGK